MSSAFGAPPGGEEAEGSLCSINPEEPQAQRLNAATVVTSISPAEASAQGSFPHDNECVIAGTLEIRPDYWLDMCDEDVRSSTSHEYVNLQLNPERNTGYKGSVVWAEMHKLVAEFDSPEGVFLKRLLSGYHATVSTAVMESYFPPPKGSGGARWRPNHKKFAEQIFSQSEHIKDMQFAFVVIARALFKLKDFLYYYNFSTGNPVEDLATKDLMQHLLDASVLQTCGSVLSAFDETVMFSRKDQRSHVATAFKKTFRRVAKMVGCVTCQRCRLHATVAMHGMGSALKILLTDPDLVVGSLSRDDIVALVNTLFKFSDAIAKSNELMSLYYAESSLSLPLNQALKADSATTNTDHVPEQPPVNPVKAAAARDTALEFVANHRQNLTAKEEDALVNGLMQQNPAIQKLALLFSGWAFVRHALIWLDISSPDAIVVGGGLAGLVTAVSVAQRGGSVVLLDKLGTLGGNSAKASSGINSVPWSAPSDSQDLFLADTLKSQNGKGSAELARMLVERSNASVSWLRETSRVDLSVVGQLGGHREARTLRPEGSLVGAELVAAMISVAKKNPLISIVTNAAVVRLLSTSNEDGLAVTGVEYVNGRTGERVSLLGRSVVLASGGFGFDATSMLKKYRPELAAFPTTLGAHTTGDGIRLAETLGARLMDMDYIQLHPTGFVDPAHPDAHTKVLAGEVLRGDGAIILNMQGARFCNELGTRKYVTDTMIAQSSPGRRFWLLMSAASAERNGKLVRIYQSRGLLANVTWEQLVERVGVGADVLRATLTEYSDSSVPDAFGRADKRGVPLQTSTWFMLGMITPVVHYTMGGVAIGPDGGVLTDATDRGRIDRLFAAGEVSGGVHGENRLGGNSLLECTVFGRVIGGESIHVLTPLSPSFFPRTTAVPQGEGKGSAVPAELPVMTLAEVTKHAVESDCWAAIGERVYDLSDYAAEHPGGENSIVEVCGTNATLRFLSAHSFSMLDDAEFEPLGRL